MTLRLSEDLRARFADAAGRAGTDRSALLREFIRWYVREEGAKLPTRP